MKRNILHEGNCSIQVMTTDEVLMAIGILLAAFGIGYTVIGF